MPTFEEKPPRVEAVQWEVDSEESLDHIRNLFKESRYGLSFRSITNYDRGETPISRLELDIPSRDYRQRTTMHHHDWLVLHHNGTMEILSPEEFERQYKEIVDG